VTESIVSESIDLSAVGDGPDPVVDAGNAIALADSEAATADAALLAAQADERAAKQAFLLSPSPEREAAIVETSKVVASRTLYAEAALFGVRSAADLSDAAERLAGEKELDVCTDEREKVRTELWAKMTEQLSLSDRASSCVAEMMGLVDRDQQICDRASAAQQKAHIPGSIRPISIDLVARATQLHLSAGRPRPRSAKTQNPAMDAVLALLARPSLTADDRALICELALLEHARFGDGGSVGLWTTPAFFPIPQWLAGTEPATRTEQAARLLAALKQGPK
jgi:hypothetical protein